MATQTNPGPGGWNGEGDARDPPRAAPRADQEAISALTATPIWSEPGPVGPLHKPGRLPRAPGHPGPPHLPSSKEGVQEWEAGAERLRSVLRPQRGYSTYSLIRYQTPNKLFSLIYRIEGTNIY